MTAVDVAHGAKTDLKHQIVTDRRRKRTIEGETHVVLQAPGVDRRKRERRLDERLEVQIWLEQQRDKEWAVRRVENLSPGGMRLDHGLPYPVGTVAKLSFSLPPDDYVFHIEAEVVASGWAEKGPRSSVRFLNLTGDEQVRILSYLEKLTE